MGQVWKWHVDHIQGLPDDFAFTPASGADVAKSDAYLSSRRPIIQQQPPNMNENIQNQREQVVEE